MWQLQSEDWFFSHVSCPGWTSQLDQENRVMFLLGRADKRRLCQMISQCLRLGKQWEEPQEANPLKEEAIQHQNRGEYSEGTRRMEAGLWELMQVDARDLSL
jgi:hypothetical protein